MKVTGIVYGTISYPESPDRTGHWGLVGGEDVVTYRETFRAVGEAMTWCRRVLRGDLIPRTWEPAGDLPEDEPHTPPSWNRASVKVTSGSEEREWVTESSTWHEQRPDSRLSPIVRDDDTYMPSTTN